MSADADRILESIAMLRVESADRLARLEEQLRALAGLPERVSSLERWRETVGRFTARDIGMFLGSVSAAVGIVAAFIK